MEKLLVILNNFARDDFGHLYLALAYKNTPWLLLLPTNLGPIYYRPISQQLYFWINYVLFGYNPLFFHISNILIHLLTIFFVYLFVKNITSKTTALYTALLWGINPIQLFSVFWISGASMLVGILFIILTLLFLEKEHKLLSIIFFILALFSNEISVFIVPIIFLYFLFIKKLNINQAVSKISLYVYVLALFLGFYYGLQRNPTGEYTPGIDFISNIKVFIKYLVYPFFSGYKRGNLFNWFNIVLLLRFFILIALTIYSLFFLKIKKHISTLVFLIIWFLIPTIFLSLIPLHSFAYMSSLGSISSIFLLVYIINTRFNHLLKNKIVIISCTLVSFVVFIFAFNNDSDIAWLYKYSKGSATLEKTNIRSYSNLSAEEKEYSYFGKFYEINSLK